MLLAGQYFVACVVSAPVAAVAFLHSHGGFSRDQSLPAQRQQTKPLMSVPKVDLELTSIMRSSLLGTSTSLICLTATASPVPQLKAL
jgi:hypothetical protein